MIDLFIFIFIFIGIIGIGRFGLKTAGLTFTDTLEEFVFSSALGLGLLAYIVFVLGSCKLLYKPVFIIYLALIFLLFWRPSFAFFKVFFNQSLFLIKECSLWQKILLIFTLPMIFFALFGALAPPTGQDELCYHLAQTNNYLRAHAVYDVRHSVSALWPYLMEMLFTLGALMNGPALSKLFHFITYLLLCAAVLSFLKKYGSNRIAFFGFMICLFTPAFFTQASFAYVDNALAFYTFISFYTFYIFFETRNIRWAFLSGVFAGFMVSVKLTGLFALPAFAIAGFYELCKGKDKAVIMKASLCWICGLLLFGSLWYIRSAFLRGNPVYPFYPDFFNGHGWNDPTYKGVHGLEFSLWSFLRFLWDMTLRPALFGGESIGPMYLVFFPPIVLFLPLSRAIKYSIFFAVSYAFCWLITDPNARFFFSGLSFMSIGCASVLASLAGSKTKTIKYFINTIFLIMIIIQTGIGVRHFWDEAGLFFGASDNDKYLSERERSYSAAKVINRALKPTDQILSVGESRGYYFNNPFILIQEWNRSVKYEEQFSSATALGNFLKLKGFSHLLLSNQDLENNQEIGWLGISKVVLSHSEGISFKEQLVLRFNGTRYALYRII